MCAIAVEFHVSSFPTPNGSESQSKSHKKVMMNPKDRRRVRIEHLKMIRLMKGDGAAKSGASALTPHLLPPTSFVIPQHPHPPVSSAVAATSMASASASASGSELCGGDFKKEQRRIRNRESALLSRKRKTDEIDALTSKVGECDLSLYLSVLF